MPILDKIVQLGKRLLIDTAQTNDETAGSQRFRQTISEKQEWQYKQGGILKAQNSAKLDPDFEHYLSTIPENQRDSTYFNVRRYWELNGKPKDFNEAVKKRMFKLNKDGYWHASSIAYNKAANEYEFMKSPNHPTVQLELDAYDKNKRFKKHWQLDSTSTPWKYIPVQKIGGILKGQNGIAFTPYLTSNATDENKAYLLHTPQPEYIISNSATNAPSTTEQETISSIPEGVSDKEEIQVTAPTVTKKGEIVYKTQNMNVGNMKGVLDAFADAGIDVRVTSGVRPNSYTKQGKVSHHMTGWAVDITPVDTSPEGFRKFLEQVRNSHTLIKYLRDNKIGILRETNNTALSKTGGSAIHLHVGRDKSAVADLERLLNGQTPYLGHTNSNDWYLGMKHGGILKAQQGLYLDPEENTATSITGNEIAYTPYLNAAEQQEMKIIEDTPQPYIRQYNLDSSVVQSPQEESPVIEEPTEENEEDSITTTVDITDKDMDVLTKDGTEAEKQVAAIKYLSQKLQIKPYQAAGVVGIFTHESHFKLNAENKMEKRGENENVKSNEYGIGINQWTHGRHHDYVNWITSHGNNSLKTQLDFAINEIKTKFPDFLNNLRNSENVQDATAYTWMQYTGAQHKNFTKDYMYSTLIPRKEAASAAWLQNHFGRVGTQGKLERRVKYANEALEKYLNSTK